MGFWRKCLRKTLQDKVQNGISEEEVEVGKNES
jgi:hypothetical protein